MLCLGRPSRYLAPYVRSTRQEYQTSLVTISDPVTIIPGPAEVGDATADRANNNLDVTVFGDRKYLAWRTAPTHFASPKARLNVVSCPAGADTGIRADDWRFETKIALGTDVREPRFLEVDGTLFLYFFALGTKWYRFEPGRIHAIALTEDGWSAPRPISETGIVEWRPRHLGGKATMTIYRGADTTYSTSPEPTTVEVWTTGDGWTFEPLDPNGVASHRGGTETDLVELGDGSWLGVTRLEGPDGFGTDVIRSPGGRPDDWVTRRHPEKLDSPLAFSVGSETYVVARRQVGFGGRYDLGWGRLSPATRTLIYHAFYWITRKRTALWRIDAESLDIEHVADLAGWGDTCFPGVVKRSETHVELYNYTSSLAGPDLPWFAGQLRPTHIVRQHLDFG